MGTGKTYSTKYLLDSNNSSGVAGQVLSTTSTGIDWVDANTIPGIIGGPFLPLTAGSTVPLTGALYLEDSSTDVVLSGNSSGNFTIDNTTGQIAFKANGSTVQSMVITSSQISLNEAVSVNSTSLSSPNKLQVNGQTRVIGQFMVGDSSASNTASKPIHVKQSGVATIRLEDSDNDNLAFDLIVDEGTGFKISETIGGQSGGDNTRLTIHETSGNVSIGATTEEGRLLVQDSGLGNDEDDFVTNLVLMGTRWDLLFKQIRTADETDWKNTIVRIQGRVDSTNMQSIDFNTDDSYNRHIDINTGSNSFNTRFTHGGNVGIGTISPNFRLNLSNAAASTAVYQQFTNGTTGVQSSDGTVIGIDADGDFIINNQEAKEIKLYTSDDLKAVIDSGGNVGIGTGSPVISSADAGLQKATFANVGNDLVLTANADATNVTANILFKSSGAGGATVSEKMRIDSLGQAWFNDSAGVNQWWLNSYTSGDFAIHENGVGDKFNIKAGGNVGIGVTNPTSKLTIETEAGDGTIELLATNAATTKNKIIFSEAVLGDESFFIEHDGAGAGADNLLKIHGDGSGGTAGNYGITIRRTGFVGILENAPAVPLHVSSDSASGENIALLLDNNDTTAGNQIGILFRSMVGSTNTDFEIYGEANAANEMDLVFESDGSVERMRLKNDGDLQIARYLEHLGDTNSYLGWSGGDDFRIYTGGRELLRLDEGTDPDVLNFMSTNFSMSTGGELKLLNNGGAKLTFSGNGANPTSTTASVYDQSGVGLTLSAHNVSIRNYDGTNMIESARFVHDKLTCAGDVIGYGSPSDVRLKENIKPIKSALDKVSKLQGVTFDWKESDSILDIKEDIGFIAQDVQEVLPELVRENSDGMLSMRHQGITPILLEAIKELKAEIEDLKKKIK